MAVAHLEFDPFLTDSQRWGFSLAQLAELIIACLDGSRTTSVAEVGAFAGDLTRVLVEWARPSGARVSAIDPAPQPGLLELETEAPELTVIQEMSLTALREIPLPDTVIIDGDHNYFTVSGELGAIGGRVSDENLPLLLFHDVCWPHARRDDYFDPAAIPVEDRHPIAGDDGGLFPGDPGLRPNSLAYPRSARHEGGPRNGVLTAVEDFVAARDGLRLVVVPAFFGFGAVWHRDAPYADELSRILDPWDRNPILERLEANRVYHLAEANIRQIEVWREQQRRARRDALLHRLLDSSAFAVAERLSRLRVRIGIAPAQSVISKDEVRRALSD